MTFKAEAIYENGVLKLALPLPLQEHQKVELVIDAVPSWAERTAGILRWTGDANDLRRIAEEDEFGIAGTR
jgi:predicted DNA-binding antitoxin AbrB/MazE fold protein